MIMRGVDMPAHKNDSVEDCLERIRAAWNAGDVSRFADQFTEDATYVIYLGEVLGGRAEIERMHVDPLGRGTRMEMKVLSIKFLADDIAVVLTVGGVGQGAVIPYEKVQTLTMVRRDDQWMCTAFQNTEMSSRAKPVYNPEQ
jgi:uncharacterized protein (TIGR02246 family)